MFLVEDVRYLNHLTPLHHPECPGRYTAIEAALLDLKSERLTPRSATAQEILACHTPDYYQLVGTESANARKDGSAVLSTGDATVCPLSFDIARLAAGAALTAVDALMRSSTSTAFCNIRPPGHHACSNAGMGFCLFNNAAIAARYIQQRYRLKNILIVDWDVHHGNGTQEIFYHDPTVFYFSTHEAGNYPGTGRAEERGTGNTTLNIPLLATPQARHEVLHAFTTILPKAMEVFRPQFIIISAGFDAHEDDPLGRLNLETEDFFSLSQAILRLSRQYHCPILSLLEGGYNLEALASSVRAHCQGLRA